MDKHTAGKQNCVSVENALDDEIASSDDNTREEINSLLPLRDAKPEIIAERKIPSMDKDGFTKLEVEQNFDVPGTKSSKKSINKSLILLRIVLFMYFGAGKLTLTYLPVLLKQKGVTIAAFSSMLTITCIAQFLNSFISGIVADKIGNSKVVYIFHLIFNSLVIMSLLLVPGNDITLCSHQKMNISCDNLSIHNDHDREIFQEDELLICDFTCVGNLKYLEDIMNATHASNSISNSSRLILNAVENELTGSGFLLKHFSNITSNDSLCYQFSDNCKITCNEKFENKCSTLSYEYVIIYAILTLSFYATNSTCYRFLDVMVMSVLKRKQKSHFGRERIYSMSGAFFIVMICGFVLKAKTLTEAHNTYDSLFWSAIGIHVLILFCVLNINISIQPPGREMLVKGLQLFKNSEFVVYFFVLYILGSSYMIDQSFTMIFLDSLKTPGVLMILNPALPSLYGIPIFLTAPWWSKKLETSTIFLISLLSYSVDFMGYSFLYNPWWSLILEITKISTYHMTWVTVVVYSYKNAPEGLEASMVATAGAIHYNLGRSGAAVFGLFVSAFGFRHAFQIASGICTLTAVVFFAVIYMLKPTKENSKKLENNLSEKETVDR